MGGVSSYVKQELARLKDENETLREEVISLRQYMDALQTLMESVDDMDPNAEIMPLLDRILFNAQTLINAQDGSLLVTDEETNELVFVLVRGVGSAQLPGRRMPWDKGIAGWVVQNKKSTVVNNASADDRFYAGIDQSIKFETRSILAAPILGGSKVLGVIEVVNKRDGLPFNKTDQTLLTLLCRFAGEVLHRMVQQDENSPADSV